MHEEFLIGDDVADTLVVLADEILLQLIFQISQVGVIRQQLRDEISESFNRIIRGEECIKDGVGIRGDGESGFFNGRHIHLHFSTEDVISLQESFEQRGILLFNDGLLHDVKHRHASVDFIEIQYEVIIIEQSFRVQHQDFVLQGDVVVIQSFNGLVDLCFHLFEKNQGGLPHVSQHSESVIILQEVVANEYPCRDTRHQFPHLASRLVLGSSQVLNLLLVDLLQIFHFFLGQSINQLLAFRLLWFRREEERRELGNSSSPLDFFE